MPNPTEKEVLEFELGVNVKRAAKDIQRLRDQTRQGFSLMGRFTANFGKGVQKFVLDPMKQFSKSLKSSIADYKTYDQKVTKYNTHIALARHKLLKASNEQERHQFEEQLKRRKKELSTFRKESQSRHALASGFRGARPHLRRAGSSLKEAGTALFHKDPEGAVKGSVNALASVLKASGKIGKSLSGGKGGGVGSAIGPLLQAVGKLGPLLSLASASIAGIVKLFIDAEAQAKELNKQVLQASGSSEFFYNNAKNSEVALGEMSRVLKEVRDDATSLSNISWGISKEDHMAFLTTMAQEGQGLEELDAQFQAVSESADLAGAHAKSFGGAAQVAVAYSRQFGVSLQELGQFQGEMMRELGDSVVDVQSAFHMMAAGAAESGIAANKFFGIIRGVSADLSLYNNRMEDTVHMLTQLGKVMNPRNAQKFLSTTMSIVKNMGRADRIKVTMMAGTENTGRIVDRDIKRKTEGLAHKMLDYGGDRKTPEEAKAKLAQYQKAIESAGEDGGEAFKAAIEDLPVAVRDKVRGELREAQLEIQMQRTMRTHGTVGTAMAAGETGPGSQLQLVTDALKSRTPQYKTLAEGVGDKGLEFMAEALSIDSEQLHSMVKTEVAMNEQRAMMKKNIHKQAFRDKLQKAGVQLSEKDTDTTKDLAAVDAMGYDQLMDTMDAADKKAFEASKKEIDFAKNTSVFTMNTMDKLAVLVDFIMNQLYNTISMIYDTIADLLPGSKFREVQSKAIKTGNKDVIQAINDSGGDLNKFKDNLLNSPAWKRVLDVVTMTAKTPEERNIQKKLRQTIVDKSDPKQRTNAIAMAGLTSKVNEITNRPLSADEYTDITKKAFANYQKDAGDNAGTYDQFSETVKNRDTLGYKNYMQPKVDEARKQKEEQFWANMEANLGEADYGKFVEKLGWTQDQSGLTDLVVSTQKVLSGQSAPAVDPKIVAAAVDETQKALAAQAAATSGGAEPVPSGGAEPVPSQPSAALAPAAPKAATVQPAVSSDTDATWDPNAVVGKHVPSAVGPVPPATGVGGNQDGPATADQADDMVSGLDGLQKVLWQRGIKINKPFLQNTFWKGGQDAVLEAARQALLEYFLYKDMSPDSVSKLLHDGNLSMTGAGSLGAQSGTMAQATGAKPTSEGIAERNPLPGLAQGGVVPYPKSPDQVFVAARPGETITPAGGRSGSVTIPITVTAGPGMQDLANMMKSAALTVVGEWQRKQKYT